MIMACVFKVTSLNINILYTKSNDYIGVDKSAKQYVLWTFLDSWNLLTWPFDFFLNEQSLMSHEYKVIKLMTVHTSEQTVLNSSSRGLERGCDNYKSSRAALLEGRNHLQIQRLCARQACTGQMQIEQAKYPHIIFKKFYSDIL